MAEQKKPDTQASFSFRDAALFSVPYIFFTGYVFRYYYWNGIGVPVAFDEKSIYSVLVDAYNVFEYSLHSLNLFVHGLHLFVIFIASVGISGIFYVFSMSVIRKFFTLPIRLCLTSISAIAAFPILALLARNTVASFFVCKSAELSEVM